MSVGKYNVADMTKWYARGVYKDEHGKRRYYQKRGFETLEKAKNYEAKMRIETQKISSHIKLEPAIQSYLEYKRPRIKERSLYDYTNVLVNKILPYFGNVELRAITVKKLRAWQENIMQKGWSFDYVLLQQRVFKNFLKYCAMEEYIAANPFDYIEYVHPKKVAKKLNYYTLEEYKCFRSVIEDELDLLLFDMLYFTGMRKSELLARTWDDWDEFDQTIFIHSNYNDRQNIITPSTKTGGSRVIYINDILNSELKNYRRCNPNKYIFDSGKNTPMDENQITRRYDRLLKKYNSLNETQLRKIRIHDFRHSHVSFLINAGLDSFRIGERMGHSKDMVEKRYGHLFPERKKEILNLININL